MLSYKILKNQNGMATLEMIPIAIIVVLLLSFSFGFFGIIHTGILNSMAARNYAFETFNHRADLRYFRSNPAGPIDGRSTYHAQSYRVHAIASDRRPSGEDHAIVTERQVTFGWDIGNPGEHAEGNSAYHMNEITQIKDDGTRYTAKSGVNPVWIQSSYGICLTSKCQPD